MARSIVKLLIENEDEVPSFLEQYRSKGDVLIFDEDDGDDSGITLLDDDYWYQNNSTISTVAGTIIDRVTAMNDDHSAIPDPFPNDAELMERASVKPEAPIRMPWQASMALPTLAQANGRWFPSKLVLTPSIALTPQIVLFPYHKVSGAGIVDLMAE